MAKKSRDSKATTAPVITPKFDKVRTATGRIPKWVREAYPADDPIWRTSLAPTRAEFRQAVREHVASTPSKLTSKDYGGGIRGELMRAATEEAERRRVNRVVHRKINGNRWNDIRCRERREAFQREYGVPWFAAEGRSRGDHQRQFARRFRLTERGQKALATANARLLERRRTDPLFREHWDARGKRTRLRHQLEERRRKLAQTSDPLAKRTLTEKVKATRLRLDEQQRIVDELAAKLNLKTSKRSAAFEGTSKANRKLN